MTSLIPGSAPLTPWRARLLRRATRADLGYALAVLALAGTTLWSGRAAGRHLSPDGARSTSNLLDELELPTVLPDAVLTRDDGREVRLLELATSQRSIVTFYAPWCGPCQEELPVLAAGTSENPERLAVVVGADEDPTEVRKKLDNLGLHRLRFHVDATRKLAEEARVTALPTTFLIGRLGRVQQRFVGYSEYGAQSLLYRVKASEPEAAFPVTEPDGR